MYKNFVGLWPPFSESMRALRRRKIELDKFEKTLYIATVLNLAAAALLSEKSGKKGRLCRI
jgi:hypothetical protein